MQSKTKSKLLAILTYAAIHVVGAGLFLWRGFDWWWYWPLWLAWDMYQHF